MLNMHRISHVFREVSIIVRSHAGAGCRMISSRRCHGIYLYTDAVHNVGSQVHSCSTLQHVA